MKERLIERLFTHFEADKKVIKNNLLKVMDLIQLEVSNEYEKITLTIKCEKKVKE